MQKEITVLQGKNLINGQWVGSEDSAASVDLASISFAQANLDQVEEACKAARAAFRRCGSDPGHFAVPQGSYPGSQGTKDFGICLMLCYRMV